nr:MAG TPA: integrase [Caudoviricetes sp.]
MQRTVTLVRPLKLAEVKYLNVAAYARVSCEKDTMLQSLAAQVSYYSEYIQQHDDWVFAGVYADEGVSGTLESRPEFVQMLEDCRAGKIDRIITKSISRFARNTLTLLNTVRELRQHSIGIYFEKENIDTLTDAGELMITLLASQAQEESRATSENCKWRIRQKFADGFTGSFRLMGYREVNRVVEVVPEQVDVVKRIFALFLEGYGRQAIANILNDEGIPSLFESMWSAATIASMLQNEKYAGDLLLQKTFVENHISKVTKKNTGELPQYFIQDDHEAIIDRATFDEVQREIARRRLKYGVTLGETCELTSLVCCGICGKNYRRKTTPLRHLWTCNTYNTRGKKHCASQAIPETMLKEACTLVLGLREYDAETVDNRIRQIEAMPGRMLIFTLKDGSQQEVQWVFPSRAESWTEEMKKKASEQTKNRRKHAKTGC